MKNDLLRVSFDVGHSSIGWAVMTVNDPVEIKGCGSVIFRADDCLASARRDYRRQRRHIRSTRQRIARLEKLLAHLGVMTAEQLAQKKGQGKGSAYPWLLAARVLASGGKDTLSWPELWDVLRWYAHNRGYDGNSRWSKNAPVENDEDTEKEKNAVSLMSKYEKKTMAETVCAFLEVDPLNPTKKSSQKRFKENDAAFPRHVVVSEVLTILRAHVEKLPKCDDVFIKAICGDNKEDWKAIDCPEIKLPKRYHGGLLFGQLVPRFDNRIISECPISGQKVPTRNSREFLEFRWGMILANIRVGFADKEPLRSLTAEERKVVHAKMLEKGHLSPSELKLTVREGIKCTRDNLDALLMHPDSKEALTLDPVKKFIGGNLDNIWPLLPERLKKRFEGKLRKGKPVTRLQILEAAKNEGGEVSKLEELFKKEHEAALKRKKSEESKISFEGYLSELLEVDKLKGRAAYARPLLAQAVKEVFEGKHPKETGGCLEITEEIRQKQLNKEIAEQTNNHLVRHRMLILERLLNDIVKEYAGGDKTRIQQCVIEVNRDLREMSGKTAKEKAQDLGLKISNHHKVAEKLIKNLDGAKLNGQPIRITASLIRKARIADDLGWRCPYTGQTYEEIDLITKRVDKDHIVPRSQRLSDSLDSLVITFSAINKWKGNRTAYEFIQQEQGKQVPDLPQLTIQTFTQYKEFVDKLPARGAHDDDKRRMKRRKDLLLLPKYEEKEFTPRDLTITSQITRLGAQVIDKTFKQANQKPQIISLPGSVTGSVRNSWDLLGTLAEACPEVLERDGKPKTKTDIRGITHLHHALDACVLGLVSHFVPNNGSVWETIVRKKTTDIEQRKLLRQKGIFQFEETGKFRVQDLPGEIKDQIRKRLAECRVVQHVPARMQGLRVEQNTWRVRGEKDGKILLEQRIRQPDGKRPLKQAEEKAAKLLGIDPISGKGKLQALKGALVISDNYGLALDPKPEVLPFHKVWPRLQKLKKFNNDRIPRLIRNGQLIEIEKGKYKGVWQVTSIKNNTGGLALCIIRPQTVKKSGVQPQKIENALVKTLLNDGMKIVKRSYVGIPSCPTTSSA